MNKKVSEELVVLVDKENNQTGTMPKALVHGRVTPLHRGFSAFIFNANGKLLLQQRSRHKKTWPLMWSNSVCGHPAPGENNTDAAKRRASFELGLNLISIEEVAPYRYKIVKDGVMENEICPILVGKVDTEPKINPDEVEAVIWISWSNFLQEIDEHPETYSEWCIEEAHILETEHYVDAMLTNTT